MANEQEKRSPLDAIMDKNTQTVKRKKVSEMSDSEKKDYYDSEIEKLKKKLADAEKKRDRIGNPTDKQWNHACIAFASNIISRSMVYEWYQKPTKEREAAIRDYANRIKEAAEKGGFDFSDPIM